jgi:hypothetical protein
MAVTASTVNTTDTLETLRLQYNNLKSDVTSIDDTVSGGSTAVAADNISAGDAAVSIATTDGNITIDAQAGDTDIIFKGTDDASDITALTLDMSDAGKAIFNGAISATTITLSADGGVIVPDDGNIGSASATTAMQIASTGIVTFVDDIIIKDGGTIGVTSAATAITIASTGIVTLVDDLILKDAATIGVTSAATAISIASTGIVTFVDDIIIKDAGTIGVTSAATAISIASTGIVTFVDDILIKDGGTIGSASDTDAIAISAAGVVTFSASANSPQISGDAINVPITLDSTDGSANAGDNIVQEAGSDENDRMLYEDALFDSIETVKSHGVTFPGQRIQVSGGASADIATLNDGVLIESDFGSGTNFSVTLAGNRTFRNPIGLVAGQSGSIFVTQDGTGSRTLAFGSFFHFVGGTAPTMTTTASAIDRIDYIVKSTSVIHAVVSLDVKATS